MNYFFDKTVTLKRLHHKTGSKFSHSSTGTLYYGNLQNASNELVQMYQGSIGQVWTCFVDVSCPVRISDIAVIGGTEYKVKGVKLCDFGSYHYKQLVIVEKDGD